MLLSKHTDFLHHLKTIFVQMFFENVINTTLNTTKTAYRGDSVPDSENGGKASLRQSPAPQVFFLGFYTSQGDDSH